MIFYKFILGLYFLSLSIILITSLHGLIMLYYKQKYKARFFNRTKLKKLPTVTIQLPVYNEFYVIEKLINAVCNFNYPKEKLQIHILDDSTDQTKEVIDNILIEKKSLGFDIVCIRRKNREGFKAGALKNGLRFANGKYIAIFDADFIPQPNFLKTTLPFFSSEKIGMVQTRWNYTNENFSILTKLQALSLNSHFMIDQTVKNKSDFFITFNGSGGIWKKECIEDAGNWKADTLTEDLDLSYRSQIKGWKFIFLPNQKSPCELPFEMNSLKKQQFRWTKGTIQTAKKIIPNLWNAKIPLRIKLQSTYQLLNNFSFPFVLIVVLLNFPFLFIKSSMPQSALYNWLSIFILGLVSSFFYFALSQKELYKNWKTKSLYFIFFMAGSIGLSVNNSIAVFEALVNKPSEFVRTPKFSNFQKNFSIQNIYLKELKIDYIIFFELFFTIYSLFSLAASIYFNEIASVPFQIIFTFGFGSVFFYSIKNKLNYG